MKTYFIIFILGLFAVSLHGQSGSDGNLRIAVQGGFSYRLAKVSDDVPPDFRDYYKKQRSGYNAGIDATYFFAPEWGIGLKYNRFGSSETINNVSIDFNDGTSAEGSISEDVTINFYAATYASQWVFGNGRSSIIGMGGLGYLNYKDDADQVGRSLELTGGTFGASVDFSYDYQLSKSISLGAGIGLITGTLSKIKGNDGFNRFTEELDDNNKESLTRLDLSAGIRFRI